MDLNKVMLIGRLARDPELRAIPSGVAVANFAVATNFVYTDASGVKQEKVEFHEIVTWRRLAEIAHQYLKKGGKVFIEGRLQTRSWEDQSGAKRYRTEIVAENLIMLDRAPQGARPTHSLTQTPSPFGSPAQTSPISSPAQTPVAQVPRPVDEELPTIDITEETEEEVSVEEIPF